MAGENKAARAARPERNDGADRVRRPVSTEAQATNLDRLIHERTRLAIVSALAVNASLTFNDLKNLLRVTDGNLSLHARKLEDAGYVDCAKSFDGRVPKTENPLPAPGRRGPQKLPTH